jgi:hypothetical protein
VNVVVIAHFIVTVRWVAALLNKVGCGQH